MEIISEPLVGLKVIKPKVFGDSRGFFLETYNSRDFSSAGLPTTWVQDNLSRSVRGILRGLHFQNPNPQGKLVRCTKGVVCDVAVDLRKSSATYGKHFSIELSEENKLAFWVPEGFAHGFYVVSDVADFQYKCTTLYSPIHEQSLLWNDPALDIKWPLVDGLPPNLSPKDQTALTLDQLRLSNRLFP